MRRLSLLVLGYAVSACGGVIRVQADAPPPPVVSVQASADVEAPEVSAADPEEVQATTEPPDPVYEEQLDPIGPGYIWVGGSWGWTGSDWVWAPGRWLQPPEGRVYVEPYYERVGGRVVFVRGYWGPHDAPPRAYGGDRIVFTAPVRPANYRRGEPVHVGRSAGAPPGSRPASFYAHATGTVRPVPTATAPTHVAARDTHPQNGHDDHGHPNEHPEHGQGDKDHGENGHAEVNGHGEVNGHADVNGHVEGHGDNNGHDNGHPTDKGHVDQDHADHDHPQAGHNPPTAGTQAHGTPPAHHNPPPNKKK